MLFKIPIKIDDPEEIDWAYFWDKKLKEKRSRQKDWNKKAPNFGKSTAKNDYNTKLFSKLILDKNDNVLDLGCGEGSITIPLSKEVKSVTAIDSSYKMLEILTEKIKENNIKNIKIIEEDINNITINKVGKHDIILASRLLNGISNIQETITNINEIANKYIFITIFGPNNQKIEKEFYELIDKEYNVFSSHRYFFNILMDMEIYPNVENLNIENPREYKDINEILENKKWDLDNLNNDEKEQLKKYIKEIFEINPETGNLFNKNDKMEWVLYWWKVK